MIDKQQAKLIIEWEIEKKRMQIKDLELEIIYWERMKEAYNDNK